MTHDDAQALPAAAEPKTAEERLAELEHNIRFWGIVEIAVRNPSVAEYMRHWEGRALASEARIKELEKALENRS